MTSEYDPSKYIPDPANPERTCPICDWDKAFSDDMLQLHLLSIHETEDLVYALTILVRNHWHIELAIRKECGIPGYKLVQKHMGEVDHGHV